MFKKFKDKLAEEMKQSPSRLQAGMQQLAQAVISPAASNNLIQDITTSVDDLNLTPEEADTLRDNMATNHFQSVDLQASSSMERSRRSSFSSVTSDNFFPSYESPGNLYHLQSDMEQSASEFEDSSPSSQLDQKTKDELYAGYQKLRTKYTKYRAVYRELYKENMKMKSVLVETQDKALRRIANLKEQCQLEQEAKAHLEEALRNDMEEKDHLIDTLTTKIKLLQVNGSSTETTPTPESDQQEQKSNFDLLTDSASTVPNANDNLVAENSALREKIKKFETLLAKCNESLKKNKERISQLTENRDILERDLNILRNSESERTERLESEVYEAKREVSRLEEQIDVLRKREEDSALSLAENKLFIHRELEVKEEQNKQLQQDLKKITEYKDILAEAVVKYDHEFKQFQVVINDRSLETDRKVSQLQDLFTDKLEAIKLIQQDVKHRFIGSEQDPGSKQKKENLVPQQATVGDNVTKNEEISRSRDELEMKNAQLLGLTTELKSCKSTINDLKEMLRDVNMDCEQANKEKECLIANILDYKKTLGKLRRDCDSVKAEIKQNNSGQEAFIKSVNEKVVALISSVAKDVKVGAAEPLAKSQREEDKDSEPKDPDESPSCLNAEAASVELKTIINDNNALRKKCEQLLEQNEQMMSKVNDFDNINSTNIKLIAEIDELNFKLRDIAELQETQDKLQTEMEGLKGKSPFGKNIADNNAQLTDQVSSLKERLNNYDILTKENTELKQKLIESKNGLATALNNMEQLKSDQSTKLEQGIENFSQKCAEYEDMIVNLTGKFTEQTSQLEKLHEELANQKTSFRELNEKYELGTAEFKETHDAFEKQSLELKELNEKYKTQCSEIEDLKVKETEILNQLDETVKVRQEMIAKFDELESCKNNIIEAKNKELEDLKSRHEKLLKDLESSKETENDSINSRFNEIHVLTEEKAELSKEIERLRTQNGEIEILGNHNATLRLELDKLKEDYLAVTTNNEELKEKCNNFSKLDETSKLSQNTLHQENNKLKDDLRNLGNDLQALQERLDAEKSDFNARVSELNKDLENAREEARTATATSAELSQTVDALRAQEREQAALESEAETRRGKLAAEVTELKQKLAEFKDVYQANIELERRIENLKPKVQTLDDIEAKNVELLKEIEELNRRIETTKGCADENRTLNNEIKNLKHNIAELEKEKAEVSELRTELKILNDSKTESLTELQVLQKENEKLATQVENLGKSVNEKEAELNLLENSHSKLMHELEVLKSSQSKALDDKMTTVKLLEKTIEDLECQIVEHRQELEASKILNQESRDQLETVNAQHLTALDDKTGKIAELENVGKDLENKIVEHKREIDSLRTNNKELSEQLVEIKSDHSRALEDKAKTITELEKALKDVENELIGRREEVDGLEATNKELREQLMSVSQNENANEALMQSYNKLQDEKKEIQTQLDEAVILYETKETQIEMLNQELKRQTQILTEKLKTNEEEQCMRIKQLVKEFQAQIHDKDEQIQAALEKRFERQQNYESELVQQYKEQLKDFQVELTAKSEQIENLILDNKSTIQAYKDQIEELTQTITQVKKEHADQLQDVEQNWKTVLKQRSDQLETKHVDEVNELTKEWLNERKTAANSDTSPGELESTSRVAMAAIQSNTGSFHSLQQTLVSQKRELSELRKLLRIRNESLEGSTEIEYLRNILFEYMMGRETLVLTRVISAVVKFDQEQTTKVLKKEEDKLTLLGSLGLL